jgi:imidazolonepropionase-like amidohydrolase
MKRMDKYDQSCKGKIRLFHLVASMKLDILGAKNRTAMRLPLLIFLLIFIAQVRANSQSAPTALRGATLFDGNGNTMHNAVVIINNGILEAVGDQATSIPKNAEVVDVTGKYIMPGLVDAHVHFFQTGFFDARPDALDIRDSISYFDVCAFQESNPDRYYESYLRSGITAVYDVGGFTWSIGLQESAESNLNAPHVAAAGPLVTPVRPQNLTTFNTPGDNVIIHLSSEEQGRDIVRQNSALGATGIKIWLMKPDDADFMTRMAAIADEVKRHDNKLIVHATTLVEAKAALRFGAKLLVHSVADTLIDDEFIQLAKENDVIYTPTALVGAGYYNAYRAVAGIPLEINDPNHVVDSMTLGLLSRATNFRDFLGRDTETIDTRLTNFRKTLDVEELNMSHNMKTLHEAGIRLVVGTDCGNPGTLHGISIYDEMEAMQRAGISPADIIVMATRNGAMAMERADDFGTLENGKMADLIILEKDPSMDIKNVRSITHVMRGGLLRPVNEKF